MSAPTTVPSSGRAPRSEPGMWLTTVLRPAGPMGPAEGARFAAALLAASAFSGIVVVDLHASAPLPENARTALTQADARLDAAGGALLVVDGGDGGPLPPHLLGETAA
jgi:hypothetical protein